MKTPKTKVCSKCGRRKSVAVFYVDKRRGRPRSRCVECVNSAAMDWRAKNPDKHKEASKNSWVRRKEEYYKQKKTRREGLSAGYVASVMRAKIGDVPAELIEAKRLHIKIKRYLRSEHNVR